MVTVRIFARFAELAGRDRIELDVERPVTVREFFERLVRAVPETAAIHNGGRVLVAVNQVMVDVDAATVCDGDEVALMPPFSGGGMAPSPPVRLQADDFNVDEEIRRLVAGRGRVGGVCVFLGTARDFSRGRPVSALSYEHYGAMAEDGLRRIRETALRTYDIIDLSIIHRTGTLAVGSNIVLIVAAAEHRASAFAACQWCIDELKATVPIWKREQTPDGAVWVDDRP